MFRKARVSGSTFSKSSTEVSPFVMIESVFSDEGKPIVGLHIHAAHLKLMESFDRHVGKGEITPNLFGTLALISYRPGLSQTDLARLVGVERATVGVQVAQCIAKGLVKRNVAPDDARKYALYVTARGNAMLERLRRRLPSHEEVLTSQLTAAERATLLKLLDKLQF